MGSAIALGGALVWLTPKLAWTPLFGVKLMCEQYLSCRHCVGGTSSLQMGGLCLLFYICVTV